MLLNPIGVTNTYSTYKELICIRVCWMTHTWYIVNIHFSSINIQYCSLQYYLLAVMAHFYFTSVIHNIGPWYANIMVITTQQYNMQLLYTDIMIVKM